MMSMKYHGTNNEHYGKWALACVLLITVLAATAMAQYRGVLDPEYSPVIESRPSFDLPIFVHAVQPDGRILVGGQFEVIDGKISKNFARLNPSGTADHSFNVGTGTDLSVLAVAIQVDGKIIIGGLFSVYNNTRRSYLARLHADGTLDSSFNPVFDSAVYEIVVLQNGKILVGGEFTEVDGTPADGLVRLNASGSLDSTFQVESNLVSRPVRAIAVQNDRKIVIGGDSVTSGNRRSFLRLNEDGAIDQSFHQGSGFNGAVNDIVIQHDGKYLVGGSFNGFNDLIAPNSLARVNLDGTMDPNFASGFSAFVEIKKIVLAANGGVLAAGNFTFYGAVTTRGIVKLNLNGSIDKSFNTRGGVDVANPIGSIDVLPNEQILFSGFFGSYAGSRHVGIVKIKPTGESDETFRPRLGNVGTVSAIGYLDEGGPVIVGNFSYVNGSPHEKIARLREDGSVDQSFYPGAGVDGDINSVVVGRDNTILIGGRFTSVNGVARNNVARLSVDGVLDFSFNSGEMDASGIVDAIAQDSSGKIIIGGAFNSIGGNPVNSLARLNPDGSIDLNFSHPILSGRVKALKPLPNNKLLIGGETFSLSSPNIIYRGVVRLNSNGSIDDGFRLGTGADGSVESLQDQADGKTIVGGGFTSYHGANLRGIARVDVDGAIDTSFNPGTGAVGRVTDIAVYPNGQIIVGGDFRLFDDLVVGNLVRLRSDGALDRGFPVGTGSTSRISSIAIRDSSTFLVGCGNSFDGYPTGGLARVKNLTIEQPAVTVSGRVLTTDGRGLRNTAVYLRDSRGVQVLAMTGSFGIYSFNDVLAGHAYTISVRSKRYRFIPISIRPEANVVVTDLVGLE